MEQPFDAFVIGDGEILVRTILELVGRRKAEGKSRAWLQVSAQLAAVYSVTGYFSAACRVAYGTCGSAPRASLPTLTTPGVPGGGGWSEKTVWPVFWSTQR